MLRKQQMRVNDRCVYIYIYILNWDVEIVFCFVLGKKQSRNISMFFCAEDIPWICGLSLNKKVESSCFLGSWTFNYWFWSLLARQTPTLGGAQKSDERRKLPRKLQEHMERHALNKQGGNRHPFPSFDPTCFFVFENLPSSSHASNGLAKTKSRWVSWIWAPLSVPSRQQQSRSKFFVRAGLCWNGWWDTRFLIQQQQLGLVVSREWWTSNLHFSKKTFGKIRLRWIRKKPIKSQHPWSRSWIFILGWYSPVGLRYHKLHLVWLGSCCETGGSRCKGNVGEVCLGYDELKPCPNLCFGFILWWCCCWLLLSAGTWIGPQILILVQSLGLVETIWGDRQRFWFSQTKGGYLEKPTKHVIEIHIHINQDLHVF